MRSRLRTGILATAALTAAVALYVGASLPPRTIHLESPVPDTHVTGAFHIHTNRSDGTGSVNDVAAAAARAGLRYVILTDHGDATREPDPPTYRSNVLVIDAVEINSRDGHIVALGLSHAAPYPLAGLARDVIDDIHRLGGVAIAAHPDSPKPELRWRGMNQAFDGIEWLNVDSEWRDESTSRLIASAARSLIRPAETIATLFARPDRTFQRWDAAARTRPVFGLAAVDAHARIGWREDEEPRERTAFERPSYETMFRTLAQSVILDAPLSGRASDDAARLLSALSSGRTYSIIRALAEPASLTFEGAQGSATIPMGGRAPASEVSALSAVVTGAPGARLALLRNGQVVDRSIGAVRLTASPTPGVYRVEAQLPGHPLPWMVSNPIVLEALPVPAPAPPAGRTSAVELLHVPTAGPRWTTETDPLSTARIVQDADRIGLAFALSRRPSHGQYAALVVGDHADVGIDRIAFIGQASRPMRISVQVRLPGGRDGQRWQQSVYLDGTARTQTLRLQDFEPVGLTTSRRPIVAPIHSLLFVLDTVNAAPGAEGVFWIGGLDLRVDRLTR